MIWYKFRFFAITLYNKSLPVDLYFSIMSMPILSFIIPAYNAAPYLKECLDSIERLDMQGRGYEVIVVDDGSTDGTAEFLRGYGMGRSEMVVVSQANRGLSAARNAGIRMAKGKYICFVDADDRLAMAQIPFQKLEQEDTDIVGVNLLQIDFHGHRSLYRRYVPVYNRMYAPARSFMCGRNLSPCVVGYFWRTAFLRESGLSFVEGMYHEDEDFTPRAFLLARTFMALKVDWYERVLRPESITTTTNKERQQRKLLDMVAALRHLESLAQTDVEVRACLQYKLDYLAVDTLRILLRQHHPWSFQREVVAELKGLGYFPLRWHSEWKYFLFNIYTRMVL